MSYADELEKQAHDAEAESWQIEERKFEINRLQGILRNPDATEEDRRVAKGQLDHHESVFVADKIKIAKCSDCNHSVYHHLDLNAQPRPCDYEIPARGEAPELCGCRALMEAQ